MGSLLTRRVLSLASAFVLAASFSALAADEPQQETVAEPAQTQTITLPAPDRREGMLIVARVKMDEARLPKNTPIETWSKLRATQGYMKHAGLDIRNPESYKHINFSHDQFMEMMAKATAAVIAESIPVMRNDSNAGDVALGTVDNIILAIEDLQISTKRTKASIMAEYGLTDAELELRGITNAKFAAADTIRQIRERKITGAEAWEILVDLPGTLLKRARLNASDESFKALGSSLTEFQTLKRQHAKIAAASLWDKAHDPSYAGAGALYYLEEAEAYLKRAGFAPGAKEGYAALNTTKEKFDQFRRENKAVQERARIEPQPKPSA